MMDKNVIEIDLIYPFKIMDGCNLFNLLKSNVTHTYFNAIQLIIFI